MYSVMIMLHVLITDGNLLFRRGFCVQRCFYFIAASLWLEASRCTVSKREMSKDFAAFAFSY